MPSLVADEDAVLAPEHYHVRVGLVQVALGTRLPEDVRVVAVEETAETIYLVLPSRSTEGQEAGELSDRELEAVAGGWDAQTAGFTCTVQQTRCGVECA